MRCRLAAAAATCLAWACAPPLVPDLEIRRPPEVVPLTRERAHSLVASRVKEHEVLTEVVVWPQRHLGRTLAVGVVLTPTGARRVAVDGVSGVDAEFEAVLADEAAARIRDQGKLTDRLAETIAAVDPNAEMDVEIMIAATVEPSRVPFDGRDVAVTVTEVNAFAMAENERIRAALDTAKAPLKRWLESEGIAARDLPGLPVISIRANRDVVAQARLRAADVESVDLPEPPGENLGYAGHGAMKDATFIGGLCGTTCAGASLPVGITELNTAPVGVRTGIARLNGRMSIGGVVYREAPSTCTTNDQCWDGSALENDNKCVSGYCVGFHLSTVAASVGMAFDYTYPAGALGPTAVSFPANGAYEVNRYIAVTGDQLNDVGWLTNSTPVRHLNRSASNSPSVLNWASRVPGVMAFLPTGNMHTSPTELVANGIVRNAMHIGAFNYESWDSSGTHRVSNFSLFTNDPGQPGQELPDLVGPGAHTDSLQAGGGIRTADLTFIGSPTSTQGMIAQDPRPLGGEIKGTSFASPAVMGAAIQAYQYEGGFSPLFYPIVKRAVLMAGTTDANADGKIGNGTFWTDGGDAKDGAGQVDLSLVKQVLDGDQYSRVELTDAMFTSCGTNCREYTLPSIPNPTSIGIKVALAWNSCGTATPTDFDLVLIRPDTCGGTLVQSASLGNNVEMAYSLCTGVSRSKVYGVRIRIKNGSSMPLCGSESTEPVAVAWSYQ